ncbi:MAG: radical SAM protein [Desulfomonile tiedjei]|nr:radical SAM protein [Desulfomonile tiedjei]
MTEYFKRKPVDSMPRLPLEGDLDLTYRCNNDCRHCWVRIPANALERSQELTFEEIRSIVDQARALGTREWAISGGEPMLRADFAEIFNYLTRKSTTYTLNTNGTLITPKIARLLRRKGSKMVALYGATAEVSDHITRNPGSFEAALRGMAYLREAGAGFTVQLIPMKDNYHQWQAMIQLARSYSETWRCGSAWLYLSASGSPERNAEIAAQRLSPAEVVALDPPGSSCEERVGERQAHSLLDSFCDGHRDDRLFAGCIEMRREFHIDPYGWMTFCCFVTDPSMRYDLRSGSFREAWDEFIPSLANRVHGGQEWRENCGSCEKRHDCRWCPVYGYLETGRFSAPVPYLCDVAEESRHYEHDWTTHHQRHFEIAGITIRLESDLPLNRMRLAEALKPFEVPAPGKDLVTLRHIFELPSLAGKDLGIELYRKAPWAIYRKGDSYIYLGISPDPKDDEPHRVGIFDVDFARGIIYSPPAEEKRIRKKGFPCLTLFPTDQILVAQLLAARQGCYMHAAGVILNGQGLLFVGHSEAGKSTTTLMLKGQAEILCDDRIIVRRWPEGFKIHGTWSHGDVPDVSPNSAPLKAILFLRQCGGNRLEPLSKGPAISQRLLACLIKPLGTREWWEQSLQVVEKIVDEVPCYEMHFDQSGKIVAYLKELAANELR